MSARAAASLLVLALASCQASPPEVVAPRALPPPAIAEAPRESFVARETRLVPAEVLIHSYTQIFGDLMLPEVRAPYDEAARRGAYFGWDQHLAALGLPDYTRDLGRATQTNTIMAAAFERLGVILCDRAAGRDLYSRSPKPLPPAARGLAFVEPRTVFAFEPRPAPLSEADFGPRFDVLHRTFLGYPARLAPPERLHEFFAVYKKVESRHVALKQGQAPHVSAWSAVCQGLVRHPEFHHY